MQVSASRLGAAYGMTGEEMNRAFLKLGFLEGEPGAYSLTQKGLEYAIEKGFHSGPGGYSMYNRYWTTRTFDDSIKQLLDGIITDDFIKDIRSELSQMRLAKRAAREAAAILPCIDLKSNIVSTDETEKVIKKTVEEVQNASLNSIEIWKTAGKISLFACGTGALIYGVSKAVPKIKAWWQERKERKQMNPEDEIE